MVMMDEAAEVRDAVLGGMRMITTGDGSWDDYEGGGQEGYSDNEDHEYYHDYRDEKDVRRCAWILVGML